MVKESVSPNFPNHFVNPQEKGEDWLLQMFNAMFHEWSQQSIQSFAKGTDRYRLNKLYSLGKQPPEIYKPIFELQEDENSSFINLDYSPLPVIPKFRRITNNRFAKIDFHVSAQAIDPFALDQKMDYEAEEEANIKVRDMLTELGINSEVLNSGEVDQPTDSEELSIKMEFGYKHNEAIDIEKRIDAVFTHERIGEKLNQIRDFGFNTGALAAIVSTNPDTGKVEIKVADPGQLVVSPTQDPYFRDIWYWGYNTLMTIEQIRRYAIASGVTLDETQLEELAAKHAGQNGNPKSFNNPAIGSYAYDSCKVPVFDAEFLSCNRYWYEKRWNKRGNPVIGKVKKPSTKEGRTYYKDDTTVVYRGKWIPGTTILFDYGLKSDVYVKRKGNEWETQLSLKMIAPEMNQMETSPIIENLIPIVDQICIAWYKLQNVIARARPKGIMIEIGALEGITMGDVGEAMRALDVLDMFNQTGILVYRKLDPSGQPNNYKPIEELNNGLGTEASEYFAVIDSHMQKIRDMIGFNDITDGTTPDPKTLNGVASMAAEATNNALHHLFDAEKRLIEMIAEDVSVRVYDSITLKKDSPYANVLAPESVKSMREGKTHIHRQFSVAIEYGSDKFEKEKLAVRIEKELDTQRITLADALAVERCRNIKQAEQILAYRIKRNQEKAAELKERETLTAAQSMAEAAAKAEEEKRKTKEFEHKLEMELKAFEREAANEALILKYTLESNLIKTPDQENKLNIAKVTTDAMKETAKIKEQIKSDKEKKSPTKK